MRSVDRCRNIADFRAMARRRLPRALFDFLDGGAEDEVTLRRNTSDFDQFELVPRTLIDLADLTMETSVLGQTVSAPILLSPTGMNRMFHPAGERAVAGAASMHGLFYSLSTLSTVSIEEVARINPGPKCFQIYIHKDRGLTRRFIERCKAAGFAALSLTVDATVGGNRERDLAHGLAIPPRLSPASLLDFAMHPRWVAGHFTNPPLTLANLAAASGKDKKLDSVYQYVGEQFDSSVTWRDAEEIVREWGGPFAIKGIVSVEDARRAVDIGASAIMLSNHGGRQLDGARSPIAALGDVVDAVGGQIEVIVDGGVRRGTHIAKAIAMGATAVSIGRPYLYALAAGGEAGVDRMLTRLIAELRRDMMLIGCASLGDIGPSRIRPAIASASGSSQPGACGRSAV